jgi:vacuolar protein sorting-associated protein 13A/C
MAKQALLDVLEHTIGKYVLNLDAKSLNIAVWSGKIELNALQLDINAVNAELDRQAAEAPNLAVPFRVTAGHFNSFQVDVPWAHIMSQPVVMRAKGLKISVEPHDRTKEVGKPSIYSVESESVLAEKIREHRLKSIDTAEDYRNQANILRKLAEQDLEDSTQSQSTASFGTRLFRRIVENIQLEITDVHINLESSEGSAGVVLESLQLVTTDAGGLRTFVDRTSKSLRTIENSFLYKALNIRGLGLYVDEEGSKGSHGLTSIKEDESQTVGSGHAFALVPLSFDCKLRQADSTVCVDYPKYHLESQVRSLSIDFSRSQVRDARCC